MLDSSSSFAGGRAVTFLVQWQRLSAYSNTQAVPCANGSALHRREPHGDARAAEHRERGQGERDGWRHHSSSVWYGGVPGGAAGIVTERIADTGYPYAPIDALTH